MLHKDRQTHRWTEKQTNEQTGRLTDRYKLHELWQDFFFVFQFHGIHSIVVALLRTVNKDRGIFWSSNITSKHGLMGNLFCNKTMTLSSI